MTTSSFDKLSELMKERFTIDNVVPKHRSKLQETITKQLGVVDSYIEGYKNQSRQRDLSVKYHWGHNHDFGSFYLSGRMGNRHIELFQTLSTHS